MADEAIPDLAGWEAYCEECDAFREVRRADENDASTGSPYSEFLCTVCHSILLTFQRLGTQRAEEKPPDLLGTSAKCPHCGELNVFPRMTQILVYVCQHCGAGVDATPPVQ